VHPPELSQDEILALALFLKILIFLDHGEAGFREGFTLQSCLTGIIEGGKS
jgi:hypothetical protein